MDSCQHSSCVADSEQHAADSVCIALKPAVFGCCCCTARNSMEVDAVGDLLQQLPPEADAPCRWLLAMGFTRKRCLDALHLAAARRSSSLPGTIVNGNPLDGSTPTTPPTTPPALGSWLPFLTCRIRSGECSATHTHVCTPSAFTAAVECVDEALRDLVAAKLDLSESVPPLPPTDLRPLLGMNTPVQLSQQQQHSVFTDANGNPSGVSPSTPCDPPAT